MPTYKLCYECSQTGIKVYSNGTYRRIIHPDGRVEVERIVYKNEEDTKCWNSVM